jgi:transcriptional regulator with XRE-family HTH domain
MTDKKPTNTRRTGLKTVRLSAKDLRERKGLTGEGLADLVGCSPSTIWLRESKNEFPTIKAHLRAYCKALGLISTADLAHESGVATKTIAAWEKRYPQLAACKIRHGYWDAECTRTALRDLAAKRKGGK